MKGASGILKFCIIENPASCRNYVVDRFARGVHTYSYRSAKNRSAHLDQWRHYAAAAEISPHSLFYVPRCIRECIRFWSAAPEIFLSLSALLLNYLIFDDFKKSTFDYILKMYLIVLDSEI